MTIYDMIFGTETLEAVLFGLISVSFLAGLAAGIYMAVSNFKSSLRRSQHKRRMRRLVGKLRHYGQLFTFNSVESGDGTVTGLTLTQAFDEALCQYLDSATDDQSKKDTPKYWDKVSVLVPHTITIVRSLKHKRPAHTGTRLEFHHVFADLFEELTGEVVRDLDQDDLSILLSVISDRDPRLVVPYTTGFSNPMVYKTVGRVGYQTARKMIMSVVPL